MGENVQKRIQSSESEFSNVSAEGVKGQRARMRSQANRFSRFPAGALKSALWELSFSALCQRHARSLWAKENSPKGETRQKFDVAKEKAKRSNTSDNEAEQSIHQRMNILPPRPTQGAAELGLAYSGEKGTMIAQQDTQDPYRRITMI